MEDLEMLEDRFITFYQIPEIKDLTSLKDRAAQAQTNLLETLGAPNYDFTNICFSLRYFFDPTVGYNNRLKIYLIIKSFNHDTATQQVISTVRNRLSDFYPLIDHNDPKFQPVSSLQWAKVLCEIVKKEEFSESQKCYAPTPFVGNGDNNALEFCKALNKHSERVMLEVTLQPYTKSQQIQGLLQSAIEKYTQRYASLPQYDRDRSHELKRTIDNHQQHLHLFGQSNQIPFQYAIKLFTETDIPTHDLITTLTQTALKNSTHHFIKIDYTDPLFQPSRLASEWIEILPILEHGDWKKSYLNESIHSVGNNKNSIRHFNIPNTEPITNIQLNSVSESKDNTNVSGSLSNQKNSGDSALTEFYKSLNLSHPNAPQPVKSIDLKPLHRLAFPQEIAGFFRIVIAQEGDAIGIPFEKPKFPKFSAEQLLNQFSHAYESKDHYLIGIDDNGSPIFSDWETVPHRLIAGASGSGKSNYLKWSILQFLAHDKNRYVYLFDFFGDTFDFLLHIPETSTRVQIVREVEECRDLLNEIYQGFQDRRQDSSLRDNRILLVVDEAADIAMDEYAHLSSEINGRLEHIARKGRVVRIHLAYCTQTPKIGLISQQVTSNCRERQVFNIEEEVGDAILGTEIFKAASKISQDARGRGYLKSGRFSGYVNTPEIPKYGTTEFDKIWDKLKEVFP